MTETETSTSKRRRDPLEKAERRAKRDDRSRSKDDDDDEVDSRREHHRDRRDRDRRKHRRRRRSSSSSSRERSVMGMSGWKLALVVGVIVVCFAMLYPKMFHPMLMGMLGMNPPAPEPEKQFGPGPVHPAMSGRSRDANMHPGMRMAAAQAGHGVEGKSGGKGMWSWMLPCYTVGVIVFLLYTLSKIMFKPGRNKRSRKYDMRYNSSRERFEVDGPNYSDESSESDDDVPVGGTKMGKRQLRGLQGRLRHTEEAMSKILEQLEQVSQTTDPNVAEAAKKMTMDTLNQLSQAENSPSRSRRGRKDDEAVGETDKYLLDLERALSDFKNLSAAYADTAAQQHKLQEKEADSKQEKGKETVAPNPDDQSSASEEEDGNGNEEHPLEPMESEDLDNLCVPEGEGEIIDLNANGTPSSAIASSVRKRH